MRHQPAPGRRRLPVSPDGRQPAFVAREPEDGRYGTVEGVEPQHENPRHITTLGFQLNGVGWVRDRRRQLFVVDVPDVFGEPAVTPKGRAARDADPEALKNHGYEAAPAHRRRRRREQPVLHRRRLGAGVVRTHRRPRMLVGDLVRVPVDVGSTNA